MPRKRYFRMAPLGSPLPGREMLVTDAARAVADRAQFADYGVEQHVYCNGYDLARVEAAGLDDPRIRAVLERHGWVTVNSGLTWHHPANDHAMKLRIIEERKVPLEFPPVEMLTLAECVLRVIGELEGKPLA